MIKTLIVLFSAIFTFILVWYKSESKPSKTISTREFEGVITYHEIFRSSDGFINLDDTVQLSYLHGNYVNLHSVKSSEFHLIKDYYFEKGPLRLLLFNTSDTLHQLDLNPPFERLEGFTVKKVKDKILSQKCEKIEVKISYNEKYSTTYTDINYTFSRDYLKIDKEHFKNWNLGFANKVVDEAGAFYMKLKTVHFDSTHKNILSSKTYDIISVKEEPIDPKIFEIDTSLIK